MHVTVKTILTIACRWSDIIAFANFRIGAICQISQCQCAFPTILYLFFWIRVGKKIRRPVFMFFEPSLPSRRAFTKPAVDFGHRLPQETGLPAIARLADGGASVIRHIAIVIINPRRDTGLITLPDRHFVNEGRAPQRQVTPLYDAPMHAILTGGLNRAGDANCSNWRIVILNICFAIATAPNLLWPISFRSANRFISFVLGGGFKFV